MSAPATKPDFYKTQLTPEAQEHRSVLEKSLEKLYEKLREEQDEIERILIEEEITLIDRKLSWQGANPKEVPFDEMVESLHDMDHGDSIINKYQKRIKNRATGIRAYCVWCQGGHVAGVAECAAVTCPLHPFRMGKDPLRGYDVSKIVIPDPPMTEEELADDLLFEDGEDGDDADDVTE